MHNIKFYAHTVHICKLSKVDKYAIIKSYFIKMLLFNDAKSLMINFT